MSYEFCQQNIVYLYIIQLLAKTKMNNFVNFFYARKICAGAKKKENNNKKCIEPAEPERWHYRVRLMTPKGIFSCSIPMTFSPCGLGRTSEEAMRSAVWREFSMKLFSYLSYRPFAKQCCGAKLIMRPK